VRRDRALLVMLLAALLASCAGAPATSTAPTPTTATSTAPTPAPVPVGAVSGDLVSATPLVDANSAIADASSSAQLIAYVSQNAVLDSPKNVTASVFLPKSQPPQGGFPVVALGRPVSGTGSGCAASSTTDIDDAPTIVALLQAGYVVVVPDYLGLSRSGDNEADYHPFLDSATVAQNMTDAVRATHTAEPQTSTSWVAMGNGQGGQAAWAANEIDNDYGWGLNLVGALGISPTADVEGLADAAAAGALTQDQELAYIAYLNALAKEYPDDFHLDDYRRGVVAQNWDLLLGCRDDQTAQRGAVMAQITPDELRPASPEAVATLHGYLRKTNLPQAPAKAPMRIVYGPDDQLIPAAWTERALDRACGIGDVISIQKQSLDNTPTADRTSILEWIAARFAGDTAPNDCREVVTAHPVPLTDPVVAPPATPQAATAVTNHTRAAGSASPSLVSGWLPIAIQLLASAVLVAAIGWRSRRWRLHWLPISGLVGVAIAAAAYGYVDYQGWGHGPPWTMWAWIAAAGLAGAVVVLGWPSARWWRRALSVLAVPLAVMGAATALNVSLRYLPTVRTAWALATGAQPPDLVDEAQLAAMVHDGARPTRGTLVSITTPADQSGFTHRKELVYLPPAWFASSPPPPLPAVMMMGGGMGNPGDWIWDGGGGDALHTLDDFALKHRGVAPVVVFPDTSGTFTNDTECVNGLRGDAADHLTKEVVPYTISHFGVSPDPANWGLVGWSTGGTCALTLTVMHPELFGAFVDLDGQLGPNAGSKDQTVARLFGGDMNAWTAFDPRSVVQAHGPYPGMSAWIGVSSQTATVYRPGGSDPVVGHSADDWDTTSEDHVSIANKLCVFLSGYEIECAVSSYSGSHDFESAGNGFAAALPWLAGKLEAPGVPSQPLPGAPPPD
jgi:S-formylglutathione hydrolase FrmB